MVYDVQPPHGSMTDQLRDHIFKLLGVAVLVMLTSGTIVYHYVVGWSWVDSFYFSAFAVTTVGFGDLTPTEDFTKLFTVAYVFSGIGLLSTYLNERLRRFPGRASQRRSRRRGTE